MIVGLFFHILAAVVWVGGMAFAHFMLRPAAAALEPAVRLGLWRRVLARFLPTAGVAALVLVASGYGMVLFALGGFRGLALHINIMQTIGIVMVLAFGHLYFAPWPRFRRAVDGGDFTTAAAQLAQIRRIVTLNLVLGFVTVVVGATGRYWS